MATAFITVHNGIINGTHHGDIDAVFCDPCYEDCKRIEVPYEALGSIFPGDPLPFYTPEWNRRPVAELVREGLLELPQGYILDGEALRPMTEVELFEAGLLERPGYKVKDGKLMSMTPQEQLDAGQITAEEYNARISAENTAELERRLADFQPPVILARAEIDPAFAAERKTKLSALLAVMEQPGWPVKAEWPQ
ncbi:MAG: hypothetical protein FWB99_08465 [Treponema sp.]|nr:hypothetical protein [Treponema sp.]